MRLGSGRNVPGCDARRGRRAARAGRGAIVLMLALWAGGCAWWHHRPSPAPAPVHELDIGGAGAEAFPQYWKRNTLLIDLSGARGSGSLTLKPATPAGWPVRLAFRVTPGAFGSLEVRAAQRLVLPISPSGAKPVDFELPPGVYTTVTPQMTVSWGAADAPPPAGQSTPPLSPSR
jgi:hypothetical protein